MKPARQSTRTRFSRYGVVHRYLDGTGPLVWSWHTFNFMARRTADRLNHNVIVFNRMRDEATGEARQMAYVDTAENIDKERLDHAQQDPTTEEARHRGHWEDLNVGRDDCPPGRHAASA